MQGAHNPLDLSFVGGEWPQTADSNRLTVDLGDVEPRARLQQAIEVEEEIALALELEVDSIISEDARANPLLILTGEKYNRAQLVGGLNQSKTCWTSHRLRNGSRSLATQLRRQSLFTSSLSSVR